MTVTVHDTSIVIRRQHSRRVYSLRLEEAVRILAVRAQMAMIARGR